MSTFQLILDVLFVVLAGFSIFVQQREIRQLRRERREKRKEVEALQATIKGWQNREFTLDRGTDLAEAVRKARGGDPPTQMRSFA